MCFLHIQPLLATTTYDNVSKNITMYEGESVTINPLSDLGIKTFGALGTATSAHFYLPDESAFVVTATKYTTSYGVKEGYYCTYNVTALKTGVYLFYGHVSYTSDFPPAFSSLYIISKAVATYTITVKKKPVVTSITIPSTLSLDLGKSYTFSPVIAESGAETTLTWNSSNTKVATINTSGKLTTVGVGSTTIMCTASNGVSAKCVVTVNPILTTGITLNTTNAELMPDETLQLKATISPSNATNKGVTWKSSNTNIAIVSSSGLVTAVASGTCNITATAKDGSNTTATCKIKVNKIPVVTSITIPNTLSLDLGKSYTFSPVIAESGAETTLTWNSSNTKVATVNTSGKLTTVGVGSTTIMCTASNGVSAKCVVTVNPILTTGITLNTTNAELMPDETLQLKATISPSNATNKGIEWSSSNENIAIVDDAGLVKALSPGECEIKVTAVDGSKKSASCKINVLQDVLFIENSKGVPSGTLALPIYLQNKSTITGLQFELALPEGVSVATDNTDNIMVTVSDRVKDHSIMGAKLSNGNYQFILFSGSSSALSDNEGAIAYVTLNVDENTAIGEYDITIKEIELTKTNSELIHHKDITTKLTLVNATIGDTNGDTKVTVTDAVSIVNYILEKTPSVFIQKAADVNNDSEITITDAVGIINQILNK